MSKIDVISKMVLRQPKWNPNKLHPQAKFKMQQMTSVLEPLQYKLQDVDKNFDIYSKPLGLKQNLPFNICRSFNGNLPVYKEYRMKRNTKRTVIRNVEGDIQKFCDELQKVVSNAEITQKVGSIVVQGIHKDSVILWLSRLGF